MNSFTAHQKLEPAEIFYEENCNQKAKLVTEEWLRGDERTHPGESVGVDRLAPTEPSDDLQTRDFCLLGSWAILMEAIPAQVG